MSKKLSHDPNWQSTCDFASSAEDAVAVIRPGSRVFVGTGCAQPMELVKALTARAPKLPDTEIMHLLTFGEAPYATKEISRYFRVNSFFIADNVREIIQEGLGDYTPIMLSDIPTLFDSGKVPIDVALIMVSPPDEQGMCSLGVSVDIVKAAARNAKLVIAEINPRMPRTRGDTLISIYDMDYLVPVDYDLYQYPPVEATDQDRQIGEYVAALVGDGSTMELGIGRIPHAVLQFLGNKKDLGIHTEMLTDSIMDLMEQGVINGERKVIDRGKVVASFALGTNKLYDYLHDNRAFSFHPTEYVNDSALIARHHKMVAINVALQVDLTGQVCADSLGTSFYSGIGGQVDFNRGAARSAEGKAIIAIPSTAQKGSVSRIVTHLAPGSGVVTTRGDVHYVVTEHGVAYLHGKSVQERAMALISIAHPDFREELLEQAIEARYVSPDMNAVDKIIVGPSELRTTMLLDDGTQVLFRPIHPTDEPRMRELFYALSQQTLYYRFMSRSRRVPRKQIRDFTYIDHRNEVAIVGVILEAHGEEIISVGRYYLDQTTNMAEVAFVVRDDWQSRGIGTFVYKHLVRIARGNGISGFTAVVLPDNKPMQAVFNKGTYKMRQRMADGVYHYDIKF